MIKKGVDLWNLSSLPEKILLIYLIIIFLIYFYRLLVQYSLFFPLSHTYSSSPYLVLILK